MHEAGQALVMRRIIPIGSIDFNSLSIGHFFSMDITRCWQESGSVESSFSVSHTACAREAKARSHSVADRAASGLAQPPASTSASPSERTF
jgi:hypothetical protein